MKTAAIYHFTDKSQKKPIVYKKQIDELASFAKSYGYEVKDIYCDKTLVKCDRSEYDRFKANMSQYNALVIKDFYHIAKNIGSCICALHELRKAGLEVVSIENGIFTLEDAPCYKPLKVATYTCHANDIHHSVFDNINLSNDIYMHFIKHETNWILSGQYSDKISSKNGGEQPGLKELIQGKDKYDILLVHNFNQIHGLTSKFCKIRESLKLDIYSLEEGFLKYERGEIYD